MAGNLDPALAAMVRDREIAWLQQQLEQHGLDEMRRVLGGVDASTVRAMLRGDIPVHRRVD